MLETVARDVYRRPTTQFVLETLDLDLTVRHLYSRLREATGETAVVTVDGDPVSLSQQTIPRDRLADPEFEVLRRLLSQLRPDDVFWDVGADKGLYSCLVAAAGCASVVAFEPHPVRRSELRRNLRRNGLSAMIRSEALASVDGEAAFNYRIEHDVATDAVGVDESVGTPGSEAGDSVDTPDAEAGDAAKIPGVDVEGTSTNIEDETPAGTFVSSLRRGDTLLETGQVPPPTVLKLDVEGAEFEVLDGLRETLCRPSCRLLYCELHEAGQRGFDGGPDAVRDELAGQGFDVSTVARRTEENWTQPYIEAVRE